MHVGPMMKNTRSLEQLEVSHQIKPPQFHFLVKSSNYARVALIPKLQKPINGFHFPVPFFLLQIQSTTFSLSSFVQIVQLWPLSLNEIFGWSKISSSSFQIIKPYVGVLNTKGLSFWLTRYQCLRHLIYIQSQLVLIISSIRNLYPTFDSYI